MALQSLLVQLPLALVAVLLLRMVYNLTLHPLAKFPGPWYAGASSLPLALVSLLSHEPKWFLALTRRYSQGDTPIRIAPTILLFPKPGALKDIYSQPHNNVKSEVYGTGLLGPPNLFTIMDGNEHRTLRKALGGPQWSFGTLKNVWEERIDALIGRFVEKMTEFADRGEPVVLSDKVAQFAADVMAMVCFSEPWGFIENDRDERGILQNFREGMVLYGFASRWRGFRNTVMKSPLAKYILPTPSSHSGAGWIMRQASDLVAERERRIDNERYSQEKPDYMQHALEARIDGEPLTPIQKLAHVNILIQAGADTTGTALGSTLRYLLATPGCLDKARAEIDAAEAKGLLSRPVQYEETRQHLPYIVASIKEGGLRLNPPAPNVLPRIAGPGGTTVAGVFIPEGTDMTTNSYVVQRDPDMFGPDPEAFRPERWLESEKKAIEMENAFFVFGHGPRVCIGKDIAVFELYKLIPEIIRRFDMNMITAGEYVVNGGVAYNKALLVGMKVRGAKAG